MTCFYVVVDGYSENNPDDDEFLETVIVKRGEMAEIVGQEDYGLMMRLAWEMFEKKN